MNYTQQTIKTCIATIERLVPKNKITKGAIQKVRVEYMGSNKGNFDQETRIALSSICHSAERQLDRKAANRPSFMKCAETHLNFDWNNIPGCIGFERITVEA
ncbi:hypothetical protein VPHK567_0254 [Vibrio phage K567]